MNTVHATAREHPFVRSLKPEHADLLLRSAKETVFEPGQVLFREGEPANRFYLILRGKVAIEAHDPGGHDVPVQNLGAGELLGWSWLFEPFVWHFHACAVERTEVIALDGAQLLRLSNENHDFGYELIKRLTRVVIERLQATRRHVVKPFAASPR